MKNFARIFTGFVAAATLFLGVGCGDDETTKPEADTVADYFSGVELAGAVTGTATLKTGSPAAANGGPVLTASGNTIVINGGTSRVTVTSATPLAKVLVRVDGIDGYYEITPAAAANLIEILINLAPDVPGTSFDCLYTGVGADGKIGNPDVVPTSVTRVGTGDVQVNLSWDVDSDVDLHVVDPAGDEVSWIDREVDSGGELDLDSNPGCSLDHLRNENITWATGTAPRGTYTVRVDYFASCGRQSTHYVVTVRKGGTVDTFTGTLTGDGDAGGAGSGELVTTFTY